MFHSLPLITQFEHTSCQIFNMKMTAYNACITGDLSTAEQLFTRDVNADSSNYTSYANRSFIMARRRNWDHALQDAIKVRWTDIS